MSMQKESSDSDSLEKSGTSQEPKDNSPQSDKSLIPPSTVNPHTLKSAMKRKHRRQQRDGTSHNRRRRRLERQDTYEQDDYNYNWSDETIISSSPLLNSTPPIVSRQLLKLYPYLIILDRFLGILTWNNRERYWVNYLFIIIFVLWVEYFEFITKYLGHIVLILLLWIYSLMDKYVNSMVSAYPTLDDIILIMGSLSQKADLVQAPITILSKQNIARLLFTICFFTPCYVILTSFILSPRQAILLLGLYILSYYSPLCRGLRKILWRFRLIRLATFYLTGLSLGGLTNKDKNAFRKAIETVARTTNSKNGAETEHDITSAGGIKYTFVLYENQRRWIGIGWTASMLSYERDCWTDEFLNPTSSPLNFQLPQDDSDENQWRWLDSQWQLDKTNEGSIQLSSQESTLTTNPTNDEGFIYYDNTWKTPSLEDTFTKYTRRRRWIRTAEFISNSRVRLAHINDREAATSEEQIDPIASSDQTSTPSNKNKDEEFVAEGDSSLKQRKVSFSEIHNVHILPLNGYMNEGDMKEKRT
ncbi:hypothetical protein MOUN0_N02784 [Monosporozyma unispora]|nr:hypothetical protein C6P44_004683 [Kazachstania unispora]